MTDAELVRGAQEKDAEAWRVLTLRYLPTVWRHAYALVGDVHSAEDIVAETMLALLKGIDGIHAEVPNISAWLRSVVRHKVADHFRQSCRAEERLQQIHRMKEARDTSIMSPEKPLVIAETRSQVLKILEGMPGRQRIALEWKYVEDLRVQEIAERLGETEKAVEATLYRARREFRRLFGLLGNGQLEVPSQKRPGKQIELDSSSQ